MFTITIISKNWSAKNWRIFDHYWVILSNISSILKISFNFFELPPNKKKEKTVGFQISGQTNQVSGHTQKHDTDKISVAIKNLRQSWLSPTVH